MSIPASEPSRGKFGRPSSSSPMSCRKRRTPPSSGGHLPDRSQRSTGHVDGSLRSRASLSGSGSVPSGRLRIRVLHHFEYKGLNASSEVVYSDRLQTGDVGNVTGTRLAGPPRGYVLGRACRRAGPPPRSGARAGGLRPTAPVERGKERNTLISLGCGGSVTPSRLYSKW